MPVSEPPTASPSTTSTSTSNGWRRTRLAFYLAMLGIALGALWQHWQMQRIVERRAAVVELLQLPARDMVQGWQVDRAAAALLARAVRAPSGAPDAPPRSDAVAGIQAALARLVDVADADARKGEPLLAVIAAGAGEGTQPLRQAWKTWQEGRMQLVHQLRMLADEARGGGAEQLPQTVMTVHAQLGVASQHSAALMGQLQQRAAALLARQTEVQRWGTGLTLALLLLSCAVIAPALRVLQAQARRLAAQAADNERLALVAEHTGNLVLITDREQLITWVNDAFVRVSGFALRDVIGKKPREVLVGDDADPQVLARLQQALDEGRSVQMPLLHRTREGKPYWVSVDIQPLHDRLGALSGFISVSTVITEQLTQQMRGQALLAALPTAVVVHGVRGEVVQVNAAAAALLDLHAGDPADSLLQHGPLDDELEPMEVEDLPVQRCLRTGRGERGQLIAIDDGDNGRRWLLVHTELLHDALGQRDGVVACYVDVTERRRLLEQLRDSAMHDALTRLPNRSVVLERIQRAIEHRRRHPAYGFAVLFMDVDRFKQVNDTLGHAAGDELLCQVAVRVVETLRPGDAIARVGSQLRTAARIGGDEFVIVLEGIRHVDESCTIADRLLRALAQPYRIGSHQVHVSVSIGIVGADHAGGDAGEVLRDCDTAMYEAKRAGRNRYAVFEPSMHERLRLALELESELRQALARNEIDVAFQPIVELQGRRLVGVEALARWRHPERGDIPPSQFIALAEECGLIDALGSQVLAKSCAQFTAWQQRWGEHAPSLLAVNLSRAQLRQPGLVPEVQAILQVSGMRPEQLQLEVTESFAAQDVQVQVTLRALKAAGVRLALDDFGTGYSSLACLHQLPVDTVKIDRSFVAHAREVEYHRVLIAATIRVARTLGMVTVAEGIESEDQAELMTSLECDRGQGWLFGRPMKAEALERWIEASCADTLA
ncbi:MAG TPA: EAL domain-containing protein [Rubrivivax sp.]|nr:EAL domain-containing protein [Rubrivivax sp.]